MRFDKDKRVVMTLDAGGTNFVFSAIRGNMEIIEPVITPSHGDNLELCLRTIVNGFEMVKKKLPVNAAAISFAFPGPADYPRGIIGELGNLPGFQGDVPLGPILEEKFKIPVFINNDGDLFTYGEAIAGLLPYINDLLQQWGSPKRFKNLFGITLGTGFGAGIVRDGQLFLGDNSGAGEIWLLRNKLDPSINAEEGVSIRAIQNFYIEASGIENGNVPSPKEIFEIATGKINGNKEAAVQAYRLMAEAAGDALASALTLIDGLAVIGGGISGAHPLFLPFLISEMRSNFYLHNGKCIPRIGVSIFNLEDANDLQTFLKGEKKEIHVPGTNRSVTYDPLSRIGVGISKLGTSKAVAVGAYAFALNELDKSS